MEGQPDGQAGATPDPLRMRISDADRHVVAERLREAAGEGRLDLDELEERLEATYAAKVAGDLVPLVADLPGHLPAVPQAASPVRPASATPVPRHDVSFALMGGQDRKGAWEIGATHQAFALMGGIDLDLREARFAEPEVVVNAVAIMGGIDIYVDAHTRVSVEGVGIMGGFDEARPKVAPDVRPDAPLVRVRGVAIMGAVTVQRRPPRAEGPRRRHLPSH
jgi:hypothetical protein